MKKIPTMRFSKAFTLLELMLAGTIGILIAVMVYQAYQVNQRDAKVKATSDLFDGLMSDAEMITATRSDFQIPLGGTSARPVSLEDLLRSNNNPQDYPQGTSIEADEMFNPLGGQVFISVDSSAGSENDLLRIDALNVSEGACLRLLNRMAGTTYDMYVNNQLVGLTPAPTEQSKGRNMLRPEQAAALCDGKNLTLTFRKLKEISYPSMRRQPWGDRLSPEELALIQPLFDRTQNALAAREAAQNALP